MATRLFRLLVVDDFEPFRRSICLTLQNRAELNIMGEVSDGAAALQKAIELQPDLIILDIGLPRLNGIEAARQIRRLSPKSKILFVSQESSVDVVQQVFSLGACGYVVKMDAGNELLMAVDAVLRGEQFVGSRFAGHDFIGSPDIAASDKGASEGFRSKAVESLLPGKRIVPRHEVGFYSDDRHFLDDVTRFIEAALTSGNVAIVVATESRREGLLLELHAHGLDIGAAVEQGRYVPLDAADTLSMFMVNGMADPIRFLEKSGDLLVTAKKAAMGANPRVSVFAEDVDLLLAQGKAEAAIQIEKLCNQLTQIHDVDILCGYSLGNFEGGMDDDVFQRICAEHSAVSSR